MEEKYKEVIENGLSFIELNLRAKFGLTASDVESIMSEYIDWREWRILEEEFRKNDRKEIGC